MTHALKIRSLDRAIRIKVPVRRHTEPRASPEVSDDSVDPSETEVLPRQTREAGLLTMKEEYLDPGENEALPHADSNESVDELEDGESRGEAREEQKL